MATWAEFSRQAPDLAEKGRALLYRTGVDEALLATVRDDTSRVHPIAVAVNGSGLYSFILPSPKLTDLEADGRYALHAYPDAEEPHEDLVRGRVRPGYEGTGRRSLRGGMAGGEAPAFEFLIEAALLAERASRDDWPPKYSTWAVALSTTCRLSSPPASITRPSGHQNDGSGR